VLQHRALVMTVSTVTLSPCSTVTVTTPCDYGSLVITPCKLVPR